MWEDIITLPKESFAQYHAFRGHFLAYLEPYLGRKLDTFTILRDPVERTISHYYHARRAREHPYHADALSMPLAEFCVHPRTRHMVQDYQCGYLACPGRRTPEEVAAGSRVLRDSHPCFESIVPLGKRSKTPRYSLFYVADLHGSEKCFRKFLNAGKFLRGSTHSSSAATSRARHSCRSCASTTGRTRHGSSAERRSPVTRRSSRPSRGRSASTASIRSGPTPRSSPILADPNPVRREEHFRGGQW